MSGFRMAETRFDSGSRVTKLKIKAPYPVLSGQGAFVTFTGSLSMYIPGCQVAARPGKSGIKIKTILALYDRIRYNEVKRTDFGRNIYEEV